MKRRRPNSTLAGRGMPNTTRHICGISGGKDSSALAVYLRNTVPDMEYFFCDTGAELPETYEYLTRLQVILGRPITRLNASRGFDHWFEVFRGALPSPQMRWCTKNMKIKPIEEWIGDDLTISYVAIRADESNRKGYVSTKPNIKARFPVRGRRDQPRRRDEDSGRCGDRTAEVLRMADEVGVLFLLLSAESRVDRSCGASPGALRTGRGDRAEGAVRCRGRCRRRLPRPGR